MKTYKSSLSPQDDINSLAYEGQDLSRRMYKPGYGWYLDELPVLEYQDPLIEQKINYTKAVIHKLGDRLHDDDWIYKNYPGEDGFNRTVIAIESPTDQKLVVSDENSSIIRKEGAELVVAKWGNGHTSPVHGHAPGYIHEEIIVGKMRVNTYRMIHYGSKIVRPVRTVIAERGTFASVFARRKDNQYFDREALIHNFTSIGDSASLHFLPEHTRDGRDNQFIVERFNQIDSSDINHVSPSEFTVNAKVGDVAIIRSSNVPDYGDHFIIVTGSPILKPHGLRVQERSIWAPNMDRLLNKYEPDPVSGVTILKLDNNIKDEFLNFHSILLNDKKELIFTED